MALKKAIVASDIGWAREIIDNGKNGFLVYPTAHKKYAEVIVKLLEDINLMESLGENARNQIINKFSNKVVARQSIEFYKKVIHEFH
jgi:glycosyltransferase involved in cell wall biosynthesis